LQHAPGEEARQELARAADGPPPSRWTLRAIRASFPWLKDYTLSGVWRLLRRHDLHIRAARVRQHSPDPDYLAKHDHLLECLRDAAAYPAEVVLVFGRDGLLPLAQRRAKLGEGGTPSCAAG